MQEHGIQVEDTYFRLLHDVSHVSSVLQADPSLGKYALYILHTHPFYELFVCENQFIEIKTQDGVTAVHPGDIFIVPPGIEHVKLPTDQRVKWRSVCFSFAQKRKSASNLDLYRDMHAFFGRKTPIHIKHHHELSIQLVRLADTAASTQSKYIAVMLADILIRLTGIDQEGGNRTDAVRELPKAEDVDIVGSTRLENMLATQFMTNLTTQQAAEQFHISVRQLDRLSTKYYGVTFRRAIIQRRLRVAIEMFANTQMSIEQISSAIGFSSRMSFTRAFTSEYGIGPSEYRRTHFSEKKKEPDTSGETEKDT